MSGSVQRRALDPATPPLTDVADALQEWAQQATDPNARAAYLRALRAISQQSPGRPPLDDGRMLADARHLISTGRAKSKWQAFCMVARAADPFGDVRSVAERLRRKDAENKSTKMF